MKHLINNVELMDFLEGNLNQEETADLKRRLSENGELDLLNHLRLAQKAFLDNLDKEESKQAELGDAIIVPINFENKNSSTLLVLNPKRLAAAKTEGYLCDIECEEYILLSLGFKTTRKTLLDEAYHNRWMREKGMPIYNIGRLLEKNQLSVVRKYDSDISTLKHLLSCGNYLIAVVNAAKLARPSFLANDEWCIQSEPDHAVVVLDVSEEENTAVLFDPQTGNNSNVYPLERFEQAWADSQHFLVVANRIDAFIYDPQPIRVDDVQLNPNIIELGEAIAENAHEIWAAKRKAEGWTWGPQRDDTQKQTPDMSPYSNLPDTEKDYDRDMAIQTLKLVQKLGYRIVKDNE